MGLLGLGQGLEPVGDLVEAFVARGAGHARVHVGVLVGFARDGSLEVQRGLADLEARGRIDVHEVQVPVGVAGLALRRGAEHGGHVVVTFHVGLLCEVEVAAVGLALAGEGGLQVLQGLAARNFHRVSS